MADFAHPTAVQAYTAALAGYARNGPKVRRARGGRGVRG